MVSDEYKTKFIYFIIFFQLHVYNHQLEKYKR
jgi:hypothetical protein